MTDAEGVLVALATGLAADTAESGRKTLGVLRNRSPELIELSEQTGEDLVATSAGFIDILLSSLRVDSDPPWEQFEQRARAPGGCGAAQGAPLDPVIDVPPVYRRATVELLATPLEGQPHRDEVLEIAQ